VLNAFSFYASDAQKKSGKAAKGSKKAEAAWNLQVQSVGAELGLSKEKIDKLEAAYTAARKSQAEAIKALPEEADRQKSRAAVEAVNTAERGRLGVALKGIVSDEQAVKILPLLGSFNKNWDKFILTLEGFGLSEEKMNTGVKLVNSYITSYEKARSEAMASGNWFSKKESQKLKNNLDSELVKILTDTQLTQWKEITTKGKDGASSGKESSGKSGKGKKETSTEGE
jgi:hypothetical protein